MSIALPAQRLPKPSSDIRKVLLVDHDHNDLNGCAEVLRQQHGYDVHTCSGWDEGASRVEREQFDFVLVAQGSPEFEGRVVLERAVAKDRRTPVVVVTRCLNMNCYLEAMQLGAFDYVEKPLGPSQLTQLVKSHLRPRNTVAASAAILS